MTQSSHLATLSDLNHNYARLVDQADVRWFDQHLAQDFMNINPDGTRPTAPPSWRRSAAARW